MNLTFIKNNTKYIIAVILALIVILLIFVIISIVSYKKVPPKNNVIIPNGVPIINKNKFNLQGLNYTSQNFDIRYISKSEAFGNIKSDTIYVHIKNINFLNPLEAKTQEKAYVSEAKKVLLKYGINPNSKEIIYTF